MVTIPALCVSKLTNAGGCLFKTFDLLKGFDGKSLKSSKYNLMLERDISR
jgi:hypothetical protein